MNTQMKSIQEFLSYLSDLDIKLSADGDRLCCNGPKGTLTPTLRNQIAERKAEILEFINKYNFLFQANLCKDLSEQELAEIQEQIDSFPFLNYNSSNLSSNKAKELWEKLYNYFSQKLNSTVGSYATFLNYGYVANDSPQEALVDLPNYTPNKNRIKLVLELIGDCDLTDRTILDVGCGRGGTVNVIATSFHAKEIFGIDLSTTAISFCQKNYNHSHAHFMQGDAETLPFEEHKFDVVTNIESSNAYPNIFAFYREVYRVLKVGGNFLYTDFFPVHKLDDYLSDLQEIGFVIEKDRDITANVLLSCDEAATIGSQAYGNAPEILISNFLGLPGSTTYTNFKNRSWLYKIFRFKKR
ncbi:MAG: methyltransferase domain-containing protein [Brasilonema octagenarum HA4186-MV1]|jgi:SAM-dependent methyltransferase|nr:methyltransferase domain-containing protein [Brasilonema octagenarum HA4186-MV1]